jgi:multidrug efflux pump subunit AcrA (membrane-fusion protein)
VDVANRSGFYLSGMYAQVQMRIIQVAEPLQLLATALVIRGGPPQVVIVRPDSTVRYQNVQLGRDHGAWLEVTGGLASGSTVVVNPPDNLETGARVRTVPADTTTAGARPPSAPAVRPPTKAAPR